jgi:hypothetical protein
MNLELGVIGNCEIAALIDGAGRIVWGCLPRLELWGNFPQTYSMSMVGIVSSAVRLSRSWEELV